MKFCLLAAVALLVSGCSGMRKTGSTFSTHAESIRVLGMAIPGDDQAAAKKLVPVNGKIETISSTPADWTSIIGIIGNILWFHRTRITGTISENEGARVY